MRGLYDGVKLWTEVMDLLAQGHISFKVFLIFYMTGLFTEDFRP